MDRLGSYCWWCLGVRTLDIPLTRTFSTWCQSHSLSVKLSVSVFGNRISIFEQGLECPLRRNCDPKVRIIRVQFHSHPGLWSLPGSWTRGESAPFRLVVCRRGKASSWLRLWEGSRGRGSDYMGASTFSLSGHRTRWNRSSKGGLAPFL